jgi:polyferredoxin
VRLSDGSIRNDYTVKVRNMEGRKREVIVSLEGLVGAQLWTEQGSRQTAGQSIRLTLPADQVTTTHLFVAAPSAGPTRQAVEFSVHALDREGGKNEEESAFERPEQGR